jgi:hypothetical protein
MRPARRPLWVDSRQAASSDRSSAALRLEWLVGRRPAYEAIFLGAKIKVSVTIVASGNAVWSLRTSLNAAQALGGQRRLQIEPAWSRSQVVFSRAVTISCTGRT